MFRHQNNRALPLDPACLERLTVRSQAGLPYRVFHSSAKLSSLWPCLTLLADHTHPHKSKACLLCHFNCIQRFLTKDYLEEVAGFFFPPVLHPNDSVTTGCCNITLALICCTSTEFLNFFLPFTLSTAITYIYSGSAVGTSCRFPI